MPCFHMYKGERTLYSCLKPLTVTSSSPAPQLLAALLLTPLSSLPTLSSRSAAPLMFPGDFPPQEHTCPICWVSPVSVTHPEAPSITPITCVPPEHVGNAVSTLPWVSSHNPHHSLKCCIAPSAVGKSGHNQLSLPRVIQQVNGTAGLPAWLPF